MKLNPKLNLTEQDQIDLRKEYNKAKDRIRKYQERTRKKYGHAVKISFPKFAEATKEDIQAARYFYGRERLAELREIERLEAHVLAGVFQVLETGLREERYIYRRNAASISDIVRSYIDAYGEERVAKIFESLSYGIIQHIHDTIYESRQDVFEAMQNILIDILKQALQNVPATLEEMTPTETEGYPIPQDDSGWMDDVIL